MAKINGMINSQKSKQLWHNLEIRFIPPKAWESDLLTLWRERMIFFLLFFAAVFAPFALIPSLILSFREGLWSIFILDVVAYTIVLVVLFSKRFSLQQKTWIIFLIFYSLGTGLLFVLGFYGGGYIWLFGASLIVGAMIGVKAANIALLINFLSLVSIGVYIAVGSPEWALVIDNSIEKWVVMTANFMLINTLITLLVAAMLNSLKTALTKEQKTAIELREKREELMAIFTASPDPVLVYDNRDHVQYLNDAFTNTFGWNLDEVKGRKIPFIPEGQQKISSDVYLYDTAKVKDTEIRFETKRHTKDGKLLNVSLSATPIKGNKGERAGIVVNIKDITKTKKLEIQLQQAQKMEAIGTLAGGIAHDFNNILTGIFGYSQLAKMHIENKAKTTKDIDQIIKGAQKATDLVKQILTFSRQSEHIMQRLKIFIEVKEAVKLLRSTIPATIEIKEKINSKATILADLTQIHQVVMNLCTNAYHAMREKGGVLSVSLEDIQVSNTNPIPDLDILPGTYLRLDVSDTGPGISPESLDRIFEPYFTTKEIGEGTGLGLAVTIGIIEEHNGYIKVYSELGKGSSFHVYFPVLEDQIHSNSRQEEQNTIQGGTERIMVVDDEISILTSTQELLEDFGYTVMAFSDGEQAIKELKKTPHQFDLIITDMTMPKMTGEELSTQILEIRDMPIMLCTGYSENFTEDKALKLGIRKYIQKPVESNNLLVLIREVLDKRQT